MRPSAAVFWIALGAALSPVLADLVRQRKLVAPFKSGAASRRGYYVTLAPHARHNPDAQAFAQWLLQEAQQQGRS